MNDTLFRDRKSLVGMVHVEALPGTPRSQRSIREIARGAAEQARMLEDCGFDAVMIENMHDRPYVNGPHDPQIIASMAAVACSVREAVKLPIGVQILSRGEREAISVALAAGCQFIRCENFVFAHVADEGLLADAAAGPLLRFRRFIGADHIRIFCDIKKKHASHSITSDISISDAAHAAEFFGADGVIVTGQFTGSPTDPGDVEKVRGSTGLPVLVGSGVTPDQVAVLFRHADALIVGSSIKHGGVWSNPVDPQRAAMLVRAARSATDGPTGR
ncbi:MAG: hypothetical protein GIKADHBN_03070 [Phycisphaerales bacterium]|nr:hypothetical protein [Phycisphaerales bacterium]